MAKGREEYVCFLDTTEEINSRLPDMITELLSARPGYEYREYQNVGNPVVSRSWGVKVGRNGIRINAGWSRRAGYGVVLVSSSDYAALVETIAARLLSFGATRVPKKNDQQK
jgi:hypothetical protein